MDLLLILDSSVGGMSTLDHEMSTHCDLICFQQCTVVHVVQTKLIYVKQKLETVTKIDVYSYKGVHRHSFMVLELSLGFLGH